MTKPTVDQLRTKQPAEPFTANREWLTALTNAAGGRCRRADSGRDVLSPARFHAGEHLDNAGGFGTMLGNKMVKLWQDGLVVLGPDNLWKITDHGDACKTAAEQRYAAMRVTAIR